MKLFAGNAVNDGSVTDHPFLPQHETNEGGSPKNAPESLYDSIIALDCAYHFHTRFGFLQQSFHRLSPGGRIALADICFDASKLNTRRTRWATLLTGMMPEQNMVTKEGYVKNMQMLGYEDVQLEDISEDVFPGFTKFLKGRGGGWWVFGRWMEWWHKSAGARFVLVSGRRPV